MYLHYWGEAGWAKAALPAVHTVQAEAAGVEAGQTVIEEDSLAAWEPVEGEGAGVAVEAAPGRVEDNTGVDLAQVDWVVDWHLGRVRVARSD